MKSLKRIFWNSQVLTVVKAGGPGGNVLVHATLGGILLVHPATTGTPERCDLLAIKVQGGCARVALPGHCHVVPVIVHPASHRAHCLVIFRAC